MMTDEAPVPADIKVNTRVDLLSYKIFKIIGSDPDEIAAKWKRFEFLY